MSTYTKEYRSYVASMSKKESTVDTPAIKTPIYRCTVTYGNHIFSGETDAQIRDGLRIVRVPLYKLPAELRRKILDTFNTVNDTEYLYIQCDASDVIVGDIQYA